MTDNTRPNETLGNIYLMTNLASKRVYQLRRGFAPKVEPQATHASTALKEIADGKIGLGLLIHDDEL
jgi:DNA-directed RNA polymerase subunit K/omega